MYWPNRSVGIVVSSRWSKAEITRRVDRWINFVWFLRQQVTIPRSSNATAMASAINKDLLLTDEPLPKAFFEGIGPGLGRGMKYSAEHGSQPGRRGHDVDVRRRQIRRHPVRREVNRMGRITFLGLGVGDQVVGRSHMLTADVVACPSGPEPLTALDRQTKVGRLQYVTKLFLAPSRGKFVRTHILDLVIVAVPFFRPARVGSLLNLARLGRVGVVAERAIVRSKTVITHRSLHFVLLAVGIIVFVCAGLVTIAERNAHGSNIHNLGQGLWWAIVTVTTVGYGDRYPVTPLGQGLAVFLMLAGIGLLGVLTATFASYFVGQDLDKAKAERGELRQELEEARLDRDRLETKLDALSAQMGELLRRTSRSYNGRDADRESSSS